MSACTAATSSIPLPPALPRGTLLARHRAHIALPIRAALPVPTPHRALALSDLVAQLSVLVLVSLDDGSVHQLLQLHIVQIRTDLCGERKRCVRQ